MCYNPTSGELPNFWKNYGQNVTDYVRKRIRDEDVTKDLTQDIFVKIYTFCQKHDFSCEKAGVTNLRSWIFQIAQNTIVDYARHEQRYQRSESVPEMAAVSETDAYFQGQQYIEPLLSLMPVAYAEPLRLADLEQVPQQEVANRLNLSLSGAKSRIQRGREKLRVLLEECTYIETDSNGHLISLEAKPTCDTLKKKSTNVASFSSCDRLDGEFYQNKNSHEQSSACCVTCL
jgi:RNA polymerase sigma-70 factor (ECF subfamily)